MLRTTFRNRWVRRIALASCVLAAGFVVYDRSAVRSQGERRVAEVAGQLDQTDPRWRLADVEADRVAPPDDQNGALLMPKFRAALGTKGFEVVTKRRHGVSFDGPPNGRLADEEMAAVDRALAGRDEALAVARSFVKTSGGHYRLTVAPEFFNTVAPDVVAVRDVIELLEADVERLCRDGRPAAALYLVRAILAAARTIESEPFTAAAHFRMVGGARAVCRTERVLGLTTPAAGLAEVQADLAREAEVDRFWWSVRGERAALNNVFEEIRAGRVSAIEAGRVADNPWLPLTPPTLRERAEERYYRPFLPDDQARYLDLVNKLYALRLLPDEAQRAARQAISFPQDERGVQLAPRFARRFSERHDLMLGTKAYLRCAVAGVAAERYRLRHGRWPATLADIPADILPAVPLDPFDGKPLRYSARPDGVIVYSVGVDGRSDWGTESRSLPMSEFRAHHWLYSHGTDLVFRLYDPAQRGLPPVERKRKE